MKARLAFSLTPVKGAAAVGVAEVEGATAANLENRTVVIQPKITAVRFPSLPEAEAKVMEATLRKNFPGKALTVSLDRLLAGVETGQESVRKVELKMDAPPILTSAAPAALLMVDGKPVQAPIEGTNCPSILSPN